MKKFKTTIGVILALTMMVSVIAGCGGSAATPAPANTTSGVSSNEPDPNVTYVISHVTASGAPVDPDGIMVKYWEEFFNVKFDIWFVEGNFDEGMNLRFAANEIPDVMNARSLAAVDNYVAQQLMCAIPEDMVQKYMPNFLREMEKDVPGFLKYGRKDGKLYSIPAEVRSHNQFRTPLVWRGDWLKNVGYDSPPETLDDFIDVFYKFTNNDPDGNGVNDTYGFSATAFEAIYGAFGSPSPSSFWIDVDGELVFSGTQAGTKEALKMLASLYKDGVIDPEFITGENKGGYWALSHAFLEGRIGLSSIGQYYHWCDPETIFPAGQNYAELKLIDPVAVENLMYGLPPIGPDNTRMITRPLMLTTSRMMFGAHMADDPAKMAKIMQIHDYWCTDSDTYLSAYYGKEGDFWEWDDVGAPKALGEYVDPFAMAKQGAHYGLMLLSPKAYHDVIGKILVQWGKDLGFDKFGIENKVSVTLPSSAKYWPEMDKLRDETFLAIITGRQPIDTFDNFVTQWNTLGGTELTAEANAWYDTVK